MSYDTRISERGATMSSDSAWGIEPPKDAEGKVIPLDTDVLYSESGKVFNVEHFCCSLICKEWIAYGRYRGSEAERSGCGETGHCFLTTHDSWDKLIDDLRSLTGTNGGCAVTAAVAYGLEVLYED